MQTRPLRWITGYLKVKQHWQMNSGTAQSPFSLQRWFFPEMRPMKVSPSTREVICSHFLPIHKVDNPYVWSHHVPRCFWELLSNFNWNWNEKPPTYQVPINFEKTGGQTEQKVSVGAPTWGRVGKLSSPLTPENAQKDMLESRCDSYCCLWNC